MIVFQPNAARIVYSKQHLHAAELAHFVGGSAVWNARGERVARLPATDEGALLTDAATGETLALES